jgi:AraC-like DNA-binding protein
LEFSINLRSLLLLIAMLQGLLIAGLLVYRGLRGKRTQDFLLALLLFFLACSLIEHFIGFMGVYDYMREQGHDLTYFPFSNNFMWGPLIWLYVQAVTDADFKWQRRHLVHFLAPALFYVLHFSIWLLPQNVKFAYFGSRFSLIEQTLVDATFYVLIFQYMYRSLRRYNEYRRLVDAEYSNTARLTLAWLRNFIYGFWAYLAIDFCFALINLVTPLHYVEYYWLQLIRAAHLYYISVTGWAFAQKLEVHYDALERREAPIVQELAPAAKGLFSDEELKTRSAQLMDFMSEQRPWLDPELTLSQLAARTNLNTSQLSYLINAGFGKNFNDFVNAFRVEECKRKMYDPDNKHLSLLGVAFECGFNSKATFNRAFKKVTGSAPSAFQG